MKVRGDNKYQISYMGKDVLKKRGYLPCQLKYDARLYKDVMMDLFFGL